MKQNEASLIRRLVSHTYFPVMLIVLANLLIGIFVFRDYGESWDERRRYRYGADSLSAYLGGGEIDPTLTGDEKGPAYVMLAVIGANVLQIFRPGLYEMEAFHFMHFLAFQLGLIFFYMLCRRVLSRWVAAGTVLLFSTQPLIWGHAFINPKDLPFMTFFMGTIALGLNMVDAFLREFPRGEVDPYPAQEGDRLIAWSLWRAEWRALSRSKRAALLLVVGAALLGFIGLTVFSAYPKNLIADGIVWAYSADPGTLVGGIFARYAENIQAVPAGDYVHKALAYYPYLVIFYALFVLCVILVLLRRFFPDATGWTWRYWIRPLLRLRPYAAIFKTGGTRNALLLAALLLGLTTSIRVLGPAGGVLVALYFLLKSGRKAVPALLVYFACAAVIVYLSWPELWGSPLTTFWDNLLKAAEFPWTQKVRFGGLDYFPYELPRSYLPVLLSIQFTEPVLLLFFGGLLAAISRIFRRSGEWPLIALLAVWFFLPFGLVILFRPSLYDNFRHFLFITPPIFVFAGMALEALFRWLHRPVLSLAIMVALLLPGIFWGARLHPYQYVYYNQFVGGVGGVYRQYELDYWVTSYREAILNLNQIATENAKVYVDGAAQIAREYVRPDLEVYRPVRREALDEAFYDYAILPTRNDKDFKFFKEAPVILQVGREGTVFTVVKAIE